VNGLVAGPPMRVGAWTLVPVSRVWLHADTDPRQPWAAGGREPVAVVVRDGRETRALDVGGAEMTLETLLAEADGLAAALGNDNEGGKA